MNNAGEGHATLNTEISHSTSLSTQLIVSYSSVLKLGLFQSGQAIDEKGQLSALTERSQSQCI